MSFWSLPRSQMAARTTSASPAATMSALSSQSPCSLPPFGALPPPSRMSLGTWISEQYTWCSIWSDSWVWLTFFCAVSPSCPLAQSVLPISHQPTQKLAECGTEKSDSTPTMVPDLMGHPVLWNSTSCMWLDPYFTPINVIRRPTLSNARSIGDWFAWRPDSRVKSPLLLATHRKFNHLFALSAPRPKSKESGTRVGPLIGRQKDLEPVCFFPYFYNHICNSGCIFCRISSWNYFVVQINTITFPPKRSRRPIFAIAEFEATLLEEQSALRYVCN